MLSIAIMSDYEFQEINLIEIDIPPGGEVVLQDDILFWAKTFATKLNWEIHDHDTDTVIFP